MRRMAEKPCGVFDIIIKKRKTAHIKLSLIHI